MSDSTSNGQGSPLDPHNFDSAQDFWRFIETHPETVQHLDATTVIEPAMTLGKKTEKRELNGMQTANNDATKREENANPRDVHDQNGCPALPADQTALASEFHQTADRDPLDDLADDDGPSTQPNVEYKVGPGRPPIEHQFQKGNPGGPGRPKGAKSMRKFIRNAIYDEANGAHYARSITSALLIQAINGNTHAIRLVCENGNNRRTKTGLGQARANPD